MTPILFTLFDESSYIERKADGHGFEIGKIIFREFPDQETYLRFESSVDNREVIFLANLHDPNTKILPLLFAAKTAREFGAKRVGLCAPYLAYMRQDQRFHLGESLTSKIFANILSNHFDWLVTVDPHLHRWKNLSEIYSIPSNVVHAANQISNWVKENVAKPVLIGPDEESEQWVSQAAENIGAPYLILDKLRMGDRNVKVSKPDVSEYLDRTPILIDDIISTAQTMCETVSQLALLNMRPAICIGVHAIFADDAYADLLSAGASNIVTCNTIPHKSNQIDLSFDLITAIEERFKE